MNLHPQSNLKNKVIVLTRSANQKSNGQKLFSDTGAKLLDLPALQFGPPDSFDQLDDALFQLNQFHWIIFSSINGVNAVLERLKFHSISLSDFSARLKIAAVGKQTSLSLNKMGFKVDFVPPEFHSKSLINNFPVNVFGLQILLPRVQSGGSDLIFQNFSENGARVIQAPAYESYCPLEIPLLTLEALRGKRVDIMIFTSSKTVKHSSLLLRKYFGEDWLNMIADIKIISIGPQTTNSCQFYFKRIDKEAYPHDMNGILRACSDLIN